MNSYCVVEQLEDFPLENLKGSVALLRSKFGSSDTTDTGQIFGATRRVSRSKTFHTVAENKPERNQHRNNISTTPKSTGAIQKRSIVKSSSPSPEEVKTANSKELIRNNHLRRQQFLVSNSAPSTPAIPSAPTPSTPTTPSTPIVSSIDRFSDGAKSVKSERSHARNILLNIIPSSPGVSRSESHRLLSGPTVQPASSPSRVLRFNNIESKASLDSSSATHSTSLRNTKSLRESPSRTTPEVELKTSTEHSSGSTTFTSSVTLKMANPTLFEKYTHITDMEQLNVTVRMDNEKLS